MNGDMSSAEPTNKTDIATNHFASRRIVDLASHQSVHYISSPEYLWQRHRLDSATFAAIENLLQAVINEK